jgi:hypothetical protein
MSVWKTAHYRDEPLQWALRNIPVSHQNSEFFYSLADFNIEDYGDFPVPEGLEPGNLESQIRENSELRGRVDSNNSNAGNISIGLATENLPRAVCGLRAVYQVAAYILGRVESQEVGEEAEGNKPFLQTLLRYGLAASSHSKNDYEKRLWAINEASEGTYEKGRVWIKDLLRFRGFSKARSQQAKNARATALHEPYHEVENRSLGKFAHFNVYAFPGATVLCDKFRVNCWLLLSKDVERIEHLVNGVLLGRVYGTFYGALVVDQRKRLLRAIGKMTNLIQETARDVKKGDENYVCRAFDVGYHLYVAKFLAKDDKRALKEQQEKYRDEDLSRILSLDDYHSCVSGLPPKEAMEVLLMYKVLPQPDFDYYGAAKRQYDMYDENQKQADIDNAAKGVLFDDIIIYHKLTMIRAFFRRHNKCPGVVKDGLREKKWHCLYPSMDPKRLVPADVNDIDLNGEFIWKERGIDILDLVKDKAIIPKRIDVMKNKADVRNAPVKDKNYLMDVITRDVPIDARIVLNRLAEGKLNLDVRADDKAEAKKPNQRWFFELGSEARLILSMYEDSVTDYAVHAVGCFSGKSLRDKIDTMNNITRPVAEGLPFRALHMSFDIKKFSPYIPVRVHKALDAQWAEAFGKPELNHMHKIFTDGNIHYIQGAIHHVFPKMGVDFEGFCGKKLTMYHCAVMGCAVRRLRESGIVSQPGRFAALIDDGLLRLNLAQDKYHKVKQKVVDEVETVYAAGALRISWDKTYVSEYYATFLHEVRMAGRSLTAGMRAILKMTNRADEPVDSLYADLAVAGSTATGAVTSGAPLFSVYVIYLINVVDALQRWSKNSDVFKKREAIRAFFPYQYGGLNLESMITLAGSLKGPNIAECLSHLELIGYRYPEVRQSVNALLAAKKFYPSDKSKLMNPHNMVTYGARLRGDRFLKLIESKVASSIHSPVVKALLGAKPKDAATYVQMSLDAGSFIPQPLRELIQNSERIEVVARLAKKFLTARSALCLVRGSALARVLIKNRTEAEAVVNYYQ